MNDLQPELPGRLLWPAALLPALLAGGFEFVRHGLPPLEALPTPLGNLLTAGLALLGSFLYYRHLFRLVARLTRQAEAERAARRALEQREATAAELHDRVLQALFFLAVRLRRLRRQLPPELAAGVEEALDALAEVDGEVRRTIQSLRRSGEGLAVAGTLDLRRSLEEALRDSGVEFRLTGPVPDRPPLEEAVAAALQAILREALVNVRKHAGARTVRLDWTEEGGRFLLRLRDDGRGFDPERAGGGLGLLLMRRRAREAGLELELESAPGRGCTLRLRGPLARPAPAGRGMEAGA
ncbi:MAG: hypothetical protein IRZ26_05435 [Clostridia bacterium]|nr:hypothetical protein [Clostridia bacterium]